MPTVGVVAVQGDFQKHTEALRNSGVSESDIFEVRVPEELELVERLIIPGGESTTVGLLMQRFGLGDAIIARAGKGMPTWGTCMGMIMMAKHVEGRNQYSLGLLDITVRRNAFGSQVHSFEDDIEVTGLSQAITGVFIRAPIVTSMGAGVESLATYRGQIVAVRQGNLLGTSFHPELTADVGMHRWFMEF